MSISIAISSLRSRAVRSAIGQRTIQALSSEVTIGGIVSSIINGVSALVGFLMRALQITGFSFAALVGWLVGRVGALWNFNWNVSDAQLDNQVKAQFDNLLGQVGATIGNTLGYLTCGILPGAYVFTFNEALGALILKNVAEEAIEELVANVQVLTVSVVKLATNIIFNFLYKSARKIIKAGNDIAQQLFGSYTDNFIDSWGNGSEAWSIGEAVENFIEGLPGGQGVVNFVEELFEEAVEGCVEAGYVVANTADQFFAQQEVGTFLDVQAQETVIITPNRDVPDTRIVLSGSGNELRQNVINTLATYHVMDDRDIGVNYGTGDEIPVRGIKPEVVLKFYQKRGDRLIQNSDGSMTASNNPITTDISFRLMNKDADDFITETYALDLARRIYASFANPPKVINKATALYTYADYSRGYQFKLWVRDEGEARGIIRDVLSIQGHTYDSSRLRIGSRTAQNTSAIDTVIVLGDRQEIPRRGQKIGKCTFQSAHLNIGNGSKPISLVDLPGRKRGTVYRP